MVTEKIELVGGEMDGEIVSVDPTVNKFLVPCVDGGETIMIEYTRTSEYTTDGNRKYTLVS